jgi:flagellar motor switch protein FliG
MRFVTTDGIESIVALIDSLPVERQFEYVHSISEMDLNLGTRIRERTITLPELAGLPEPFLSARLQEQDGDTLALSMLRMEAPLRGKLLSLLPERMQMMVQSSMESRSQATAAEVEAAQRRLLSSVREEIRKHGRPA